MLTRGLLTSEPVGRTIACSVLAAHPRCAARKIVRAAYVASRKRRWAEPRPLKQSVVVKGVQSEQASGIKPLSVRLQGPVCGNLNLVAARSNQSTRPGAADYECHSNFVQWPAKQQLFIDPGSHIQNKLEAWLDLRTKPPPPDSPPVPLIINGLIKTGKTYALNSILPAVVRKHSCFGVGKPREVVIIKLDMSHCGSKGGGFEHAVKKLHGLLLEQIRALNIPVSQQHWDIHVWQYQTDPVSATIELMRHLEGDVLVLVDEAQAFMLPGNADELDLKTARDARAFFKNLLFHTPENILWAVTGSAMATYWLSASLAPKGGVTLTMHNWKVNLPVQVDEQVMDNTWSALCHDKGLDSAAAVQLLNLSGPTPSQLVYLVSEWEDQGRPGDTSRFVAQHVGEKLVAETFDDLSIILQMMEPRLRQLLHLVTQEGYGADLDIIGQQPGMLSWLGPYLKPVAGGSNMFCLASAQHRQLFQLLVDPDGELQRGVEIPVVGSPSYWEAKELLLELCNSIVTAKKRHYKGMQLDHDIQKLLKDWAQSMEERWGPASSWEHKPWFQRVLLSEYNTRGTATAYANQAGLEPYELLGWYHQMLRNCLADEELKLEESVPRPRVVEVETSSADDHDQGRRMSILKASGSIIAPFKAEDISLLDSWPVACSLREMVNLISPIRRRWLSVASSSSDGDGDVDSGDSGDVTVDSNSDGCDQIHTNTPTALSSQQSGVLPAPPPDQLPPMWLAWLGMMPVKFLNSQDYIKRKASS